MDGLNGSFDKTEFDLASAENTTIENAPTDTTAFGISGGAITKDQKIGTITVKITSDTSDTTMVKIWRICAVYLKWWQGKAKQRS